MIRAGWRMGNPSLFGVILMPVSIVAALQIGSLPGGKADTLAQILAYEDPIRRSGAQLVVMPEALLGGYPKGEGFGTQLGYRLPEGREAFARYFANAIDVPGAETEALAGLSARTRASASSLATGSLPIGICAAMPPMACAPRWWQVWISSSE